MRPAEAFAHLTNLARLASAPDLKLQAAQSLVEIAQVLGPSRVQSELLPFLADAIEGPPNLPLLPPIPAEEAGVVPTDPTALPAQPSPLIQELLDLKRRPTLAVIGASPETRAALFQAMMGTVECDKVNEVLAIQLREFVPKLVPLDQAVFVIGLLCQLAASADVGVRNEAVLSILSVMRLFKRSELLRTGCVDLFLGMATSEIPYKRASVAHLLPSLLRTLLASDAPGGRNDSTTSTSSSVSSSLGAEEDLWPLQAEVVKLFFDISTNSATIARRAFALNFADIVTLLYEQEGPRAFLRRYPLEGGIRSSATARALVGLKSLCLAPWELDLCVLPYTLAEEAAPELRALAIPTVLFLGLMHFMRLVYPTLPEHGLKRHFPTLWTMLQEFIPTPPRRKRSATLEVMEPDYCERCRFGWTGLSCIEGMFSLAGSPIFEGFVQSFRRMRSEPLLLRKADPDNAGVTQYRELCEKLVSPLLLRMINNEWAVRVVLVDALPFLFDIFLPFIPANEAELFLDRAWLGLLQEDDHLEVRTRALQSLPLHAYLLSQSHLRGLYEAAPTEEISCERPCEIRGLSDMPKFLDRCGKALQSAAADSELRLRLASADACAHFLLIIHKPEIVANSFVAPFLSLLRDANQQVVLSTLASLRVLTTVHKTPRDVDKLTPRLPVGIRSGLWPSLPFSQYLPFERRTALNDIGVSRVLLDLLSQATIPAVAQCLVASTTTASSADVSAKTIFLWRVQCATLHALPTLNELLCFTDGTRLSTSNELFSSYALWMQHLRLCLQDPNTSIVRLCAAQATIKLMKNADHLFGQYLISPILVSARTPGSKLNVRLAVPSLAEALAAELADHVERTKTAQRGVALVGHFGFSAVLWTEVRDTLKACATDKVSTLRCFSERAQTALSMWF